jgi:DNA-directed RNA polymerase subunit RPC12/RpoP
MPTRYRCTDCGLGFETGWYHYHRESDNAMAATSLACATCGSAYLVGHKYDGSRDQLYVWGGPVTWVPTGDGSWHNPAHGSPPMAPVPCDHEFRPIRTKERLARLEGIRDHLELAGFACVFCHAAGTLTNEWPTGQTAWPRCGKSTLEVVGCYLT